jgi:hypothetical protein
MFLPHITMIFSSMTIHGKLPVPIKKMGNPTGGDEGGNSNSVVLGDGTVISADLISFSIVNNGMLKKICFLIFFKKKVILDQDTTVSSC